MTNCNKLKLICGRFFWGNTKYNWYNLQFLQLQKESLPILLNMKELEDLLTILFCCITGQQKSDYIISPTQAHPAARSYQSRLAQAHRFLKQ